MLNRQKCILYMLEQAGRPVARLELTKWAFLLARETASGGGPAFYDFLPYHYGPYSFTLFHEAERLVRDGYLRPMTAGGRDAWESLNDSASLMSALATVVRRDAAGVVRQFANVPLDDLIDYVYGRFPWYTANSRIRQLRARPAAPPGIYTIGYEGCSVDRLLDGLMRRGIRRIIDVRRNPVARRYGFHKASLDRLCGNVGIAYVHVPEVGIPSDLRRNLDGPDARARLLAMYDAELLPRQGGAIAEIARMAAELPSALMCMEADPAVCHRSRVAQAASSVTGLPVQHLRGKTCGPDSN